MLLLVLGIIIFCAIHLFPNLVALRQRLMTLSGKGGYKGIFSVISLLGLILIVVGKSRAEFQPVWEPLVWGKKVAMAMMLPSFILLASADMPSNIKRFTRHPMLWGVTLWAAAHLMANGDLASLILFGSLGVFALAAIFLANLRGITRQQTKRPYIKDAIAIMAGCVAYGAFLFLHRYIIGVPLV